jgi:hypothetical protein
MCVCVCVCVCNIIKVQSLSKLFFMQGKWGMTTMNWACTGIHRVKKWLPNLCLTVCFPFHLLSACGCSIEFVLAHIVLSKLYCNLVSLQHCFGLHLFCGIVCRIKLQRMLPLFVVCEFWQSEHLQISPVCDKCVACNSMKWEVFHAQLT